ncbi:hypothetical protein Bca4012_031201 [Brassica carinata]
MLLSQWHVVITCLSCNHDRNFRTTKLHHRPYLLEENSHPFLPQITSYIIGIRDLILPPRRDAFEDVYIVNELMEYDLHKVITFNQELEPLHYKFFLYQILRGLKYIHAANVIHRDLKPANLLVNANCELKICDFGLARGASENNAMTEYVVTRWYRAPELLLNSSVYTSAIDVWSVGCIFLELLTRKLVFRAPRLSIRRRTGSLSENAKLYLRQLPYHDRQSFFVVFPNVPYPALDLIMKMLKFDPRQRISVEDALDHPYLREMHGFTDEPVCMTPFNFDLEEQPFTEEEIKDLIYREALAFSP